MINHILKTIWADRRINGWILLELIVVFSILWFCTDYLYFMAKRSLEPKGFDIEHTYRIGIDAKDEGREVLFSGSEEEKSKMRDDIWTIYDRIKKYPAIENISYSFSAYPYSGSWSQGGIIIDSVSIYTQFKTVTPEFFNVFKINIISGKSFTWDDMVADNPVVISTGRDGLLGNKQPQDVPYIEYGGDHKEKVVGVAEKIKRNEYEDYDVTLYRALKKDHRYITEFRELCVRVKPDADVNFEEKFTNDMRNQLKVGHYYLSSIVPMEKERQMYMEWNGYDNNFKSIYSITAFLIVNIFLGIIGTFWFRIQSRRSEIGLRIALGASKSNVKNMFVQETVLLLFLASILATIICVNISVADLIKDINVPIPDRGENGAGIVQYFINYGITFLFLAIIAIVAVWYPAKKASDIQPTEALRDE
ncbi:ABC transporter permease [Prevotella sp. 10(H)]|uniref:ABC transporter permease n=1 Tax=Prevotella sp. 10(H) TaxID=1158294 RepID=UPI0004A74983|nr:FtsX-like permease family protein [Prevotella sp. 10(H)]